MPPADEAQQLARIAAATEDLDEILDKLFATVAEVKTILAREPAAPAEETPVSETTPGSDLIAAVERVTAALDGVRSDLRSLRRELGTARRDVQRGRRIITGLIVSFCLDLIVTGLVGYNTVRVNDTQDASRASEISACRQANVNRAEDIAIWNRFLDDIAPPAARARTTPKIRSELAEINRLIRVKDTPRNCAALYSGST